MYNCTPAVPLIKRPFFEHRANELTRNGPTCTSVAPVHWKVDSKNQVSCRPTVVLIIILCLFGFEQIRRSYFSGRDDDYLVGSFLEKFAL